MRETDLLLFMVAILPGIGLSLWALHGLKCRRLVFQYQGGPLKVYEGSAAVRISLLLLVLGIVYSVFASYAFLSMIPHSSTEGRRIASSTFEHLVLRAVQASTRSILG